MPDQYRCPLPTRSPSMLDQDNSRFERMAWLKESRARGEQWLASQRSTIDANQAMDLICNMDDGPATDASLSDVKSGEIERDMLELIAELSNMRAEGIVKTDNRDFYDQSAIIQKRYKAWFQMTRAKRKIRSALAYAAVMGTGGLILEWKSDYWGPGRGENVLRAVGPGGMLPDGLPPDGDFQRAYAVHLVEEVPIHDARRRFPLFADQLNPDRGMPSGWAKRVATFSRFLSPVLNMFGVRGDKKLDQVSLYPTVDLVKTYIYDDSINLTTEPIVTGRPNTLWETTVPPVGSEIETGLFDEQGRPVMRIAQPDDARLYPNRRLVTWCSSCLLDDDHSPYWHGKVPLFRFKLKDWPWEPNGVAPLKSVASIGRAITRVIRAIDDAINARLNPAMFVDDSLISMNAAESVNTRIAGLRVKADLSMGGDVMKPIVPLQTYDVSPIALEFLKGLRDDVKRNLFIQDITALQKGKMIPNGDTLDKMVELAGPIVKDMLESIEDSISEMGSALLYNFFEFDSLARRLDILGDDGISKDDFDYDPGLLVPSHLPGEKKVDDSGNAIDSKYTRLERAMKHARKFYFYIVPGSLHELSRTTAKLMLLQAMKGGLKVDQWTMAKYFGIPYYGAEPAGTTTVMERVIAERRMEIEMQAEAQKQVQAATGGEGEMGDAGTEGSGAGRPPTNAKAPQLASKDGGTRTTAETS